MRWTIRTDRRGAASLVNHILAIGITTILITGLLVAGGSYLNNQQEYAAQSGLDTIGNELAETITQLQRLSAGNGSATIQVDLPERVSGSSYSVRIVNGSECTELRSTPNSCLELEVTRLDVVRNIPLSVNETDVNISTVSASHYRLEWNGSSAPGTIDETGATDAPLRLGIGGDVAKQRTGGSIIGETNLPPTNVSFTVDPEYPDTNRGVTFTANAEDPDPDNPASPGLNYSWDFDGDGTYEEQNLNTATTTHTYGGGNYGPQNVTLRVTDEENASTWHSHNITVAGLAPLTLTRTPADDRTRAGQNVNFDGDDIMVRFENTHSNDITITGVFFDPEGTGGEMIAEDRYVCTAYGYFGCNNYNFYYFPEIRINTNENEDNDYTDTEDEQVYIGRKDLGCEGLTIPDGGVSMSAYAIYGSGTYYECDFDPRDRVEIDVEDGDNLAIQYRAVEGLPADPDFTIGVRYRVGGETYTTRFTEEVGGLP